MIKFFLFIKKIHFLLLFILLESLAIHYYANSTSYTKVKLVTASNYVVGGIYSQIAGLNSYFHLRRSWRCSCGRQCCFWNGSEGKSYNSVKERR